MDPKVIQLLDQLSLKLGVASDTAWAALLWQARMHSILVGSLLLITGVVTAWACWRVYVRWEWIEEHDAEVFVLPLSIPIIFWWMAFFINIESLLISSLNPEAWAVSRLLSLLG